MRRRHLVGLGLVLALSLLLPADQGAAQGARQWPRANGGGASVRRPPLRAPSSPQRLPNYYFERNAPAVAPRGPLGPGDVTTSLRARGFRDIGPIQQRGKTMIVPKATGPSGESVQLVIGPNGEIMGVRVLPPGER
jgi:hypothetical protein